MALAAVPLVIYSDGPRLPTGLARIARDLASRCWEDREDLGVELLQVGWDPKPGLAVPWPVFSFGSMDMGESSDWGARDLAACWREWYGHDQGVLLSIWDPARAYSLLGLQGPERSLWGYFPIDGVNIRGSVGGPAREAIGRYDRALAYGRWGSQVLRTIRSPVPYLPHGLDLSVWTLEHTKEQVGAAERILQPKEGEWVLGCVATNQPRKDLGLYFATLAELRRRGERVRGWLHTDRLVRSWSVQQLIEDFGLARKVSVSTLLDDQTLAACYACCGVTLAPGLGEGFGYPIVESLACGTPVVHPDYGGGSELVPMNAWRVPFGAERLEGLYGLRRPVVTPVNAANAVMRALEWKRSEERVVQEYCRGSVSHLDWTLLWPRWRTWFKQGLELFRG